MSQGDDDPAIDPKTADAAERVTIGRHVVFSLGREGGRCGRKISSLVEVAGSEGHEPHSTDYRGLDDPRQRVVRRAQFCNELADDLVPVGSSPGGYVAVFSASLLHARGVF